MPASTSLRHLKDIGLNQVETPLRSFNLVKLVSLTYVAVGTSLRRLKLVDFIYLPVRRRKNVYRSVLLKYQLRRRDDVSAWFRMFKLVTKMGQFVQILGSMFFDISDGSDSLRYKLVRRCNVSKTSLSFRYQL